MKLIRDFNGEQPFVYMVQHAYLNLTNSGGVQEEAPSLGKPVWAMWDTTE
jgi:UDP-N-acetylglucosamine 2-epimerase (non-hydrolysing)